MNLKLLQLGDSALPIGGYSHSWGLEAAIEHGAVRDAAGLEKWARSWLTLSLAPFEGVVVAATCHRPQIPRRGANISGHHLRVSLESTGRDHDGARPYRERLPSFIARRNSRSSRDSTKIAKKYTQSSA